MHGVGASLTLAQAALTTCVLSAFEGDSCPEVHTAVRASGFLQAGRGSGAEVPSLQGHPFHAVEGPPATAPGGDSWLCRSSADTL